MHGRPLMVVVVVVARGYFPAISRGRSFSQCNHAGTASCKRTRGIDTIDRCQPGATFPSRHWLPSGFCWPSRCHCLNSLPLPISFGMNPARVTNDASRSLDLSSLLSSFCVGSRSRSLLPEVSILGKSKNIFCSLVPTVGTST